jgi:hypothetical protein
MFCMTLMTPTPSKVATTLRQAKVTFKLVRTREANTLKGAQHPEIAQKIYDAVARGLTYQAVGEQFQVSWHTVLRVAHNPEKYGVKGPPIRRK